MKSCIYGVETANTGVGLHLCWHYLVVWLFEKKTVKFTSKRVCKIHFMTKLCNPCPTLTRHIAGLRVDKNKSELEYSQKEMKQSTNTWVVGYDWLIVGEIHYPFRIFFPTTPSLSIATKKFPSANTLSSVTYSGGNVMFSSSLNGSPTSSGYWQFLVVSCIDVKSNTSS